MIYKKGDLLKGGDDVIVHGCNCICNMGAGVALQIKNEYPEAFAADQATKYGDRSKLGCYTSWEGTNKYVPQKNIIIVNAYTQFDIFSHKWRSGFDSTVPKIPFDYEAFERVLPKIRDDFKDKSIAFPKIGAGLAHGDWDIISKMIEDCFQEKIVKVYYL